MNESTTLKIGAMICITWLETLALIYLNIDGTLLSTVVGVIAGIAGYTIGKKTSEE
ncbi:MAG: hypothetical protein MRT15_09355 [archaeon YNP-LCB-003-016]|uniref:hypothetical protein n=1 Tax=Candidatus Culexarchaeum yellowstonense TaxID=2928963 RepID=UPI0026F2A1E7|nr:hypothetical protein [Candidatus Culexarchaeum yellowstonense]MCR6692586.1 hypothetical protein [Candidatus Culexarchaeum yellowstonense]